MSGPRAKRQLLLPIARRHDAPAKAPYQAKRDMTEGEFVCALIRCGFEPTRGGLRFGDRATGALFEGVYDHHKGRLSRRATLAKIKRERDLFVASRVTSPPAKAPAEEHAA